MIYNNLFLKNATEEIKNMRHREYSANYSNPSSVEGRRVCLLRIPAHATGIFLKPILYTARSISMLLLTAASAVLFAGTKLDLTKTKDMGNLTIKHIKQTFDFIGCSVISPFGQFAKLLRAVGGVVRPDIYFTPVKNVSPKHEIATPPGEMIVGPRGGIYHPNFLEALNTNQPKLLSQEDIDNKADCEAWHQTRDNYNAFCERLTHSDVLEQPRIPKKIHLIWLGSEPNDEVVRVRDSWIEHHPENEGWEVKLWNDQDVQQIIDKKRQQYKMVGETWDKATRFAEKADIARYCILEEEGGTYADSDLPCYGKIDDLHDQTDFYAALEQNDHHVLYVGNALIGAAKGNETIRGCLRNLKPRKPNEDSWAIIGRTGPGLLTDHVYRGLARDRGHNTNNTLILPPAYFYPLHSGSKEDARNDTKFAEDKVQPWTKGLHLWNLSWV